MFTAECRAATAQAQTVGREIAEGMLATEFSCTRATFVGVCGRAARYRMTTEF
ncbi:hypothetical protein [Ruegeria sp. MALMAid1280]|uniref:hypothetical protein n=1 Tax=Ruegeria sp. MALMAid1280 TaxID=3411634 RepID=UPI003BA07FA5